MNRYTANKIVRLLLAKHTKNQESLLQDMFPGAHIRCPVPVTWFDTLADCVRFIEGGFDKPTTHEERKEFMVPHDENTTDAEAMDNYASASLKAFAKRNGLDYTACDGDSSVRIPGRRVIAAANRYGDLICVGTRHGGPAMWSQLEAVKEDRLLEADKLGRAEEGFIDQYDVFMTREEAYEVALASGQINVIRLKHSTPGRLYSEDIH